MKRLLIVFVFGFFVTGCSQNKEVSFCDVNELADIQNNKEANKIIQELITDLNKGGYKNTEEYSTFGDIYQNFEKNSLEHKYDPKNETWDEYWERRPTRELDELKTKIDKSISEKIEKNHCYYFGDKTTNLLHFSFYQVDLYNFNK